MGDHRWRSCASVSVGLGRSGGEDSPSFPGGPPPSLHLPHPTCRGQAAPRREPGKGGVRRHPPSDRRRQAPRATQHARARRVPSTQGRGCDLSPRPKMRPVQKKKKKSVMTCCGIQDPVSQNPTLRPTGSQKAFSNRTRLAALTQIAPSFFKKRRFCPSSLDRALDFCHGKK